MILKADNVTRQFLREREDSNIFCAVEQTTLEIPEGRITCLAGPSGSGKTTLLSMLAGILQPTDGKVLADEMDLYTMGDKKLSAFRNTHIGVIPQGQTGLQALTVLENVMLPTRLGGGKKHSARELNDRAEKLLASVGVDHLSRVMVSELSGGEMQRMAVARALINDPEVLLADEPTADLDTGNTNVVLSVLRRAADEGKAILVVTHDPRVMDFADTVYHMNRGRLEEKE